jgi:hypothetical protein
VSHAPLRALLLGEAAEGVGLVLQIGVTSASPGTAPHHSHHPSRSAGPAGVARAVGPDLGHGTAPDRLATSHRARDTAPPTELSRPIHDGRSNGAVRAANDSALAATDHVTTTRHCPSAGP